jgi:hypothetical protein
MLKAGGASFTKAQTAEVYSRTNDRMSWSAPALPEFQKVELPKAMSTAAPATGGGAERVTVVVSARVQSAPVASGGAWYAQLRCDSQDWTYDLRQPSTLLGRQGATGSVADVLLGDDKSISRRHAAIWLISDSGQDSLGLECLSKNCLHLNGELYGANGKSVLLSHDDVISIGGAKYAMSAISTDPVYC